LAHLVVVVGVVVVVVVVVVLVVVAVVVVVVIHPTCKDQGRSLSLRAFQCQKGLFFGIAFPFFLFSSPSSH